ncbi:MAG: endonuclease/exonuclease/phosphatase family protein [Acidimicrobiia bacterium]|nr:endonuclease/exonuclease/phosphatase family protein [Acidimicrobiia bacterium]
MATRSTDDESDPAPDPAADRSTRPFREPRPRLRDRVPSRRERLTPVKRLRRRAVPSDEPVIVGDHRPSSESTKGPAGRTAFRLVCWNIEDGLDVDGTLAGLTGHPNLASADAVCLQEMDPDGVERIARELGLSYLYIQSSQDERTGRGFGNAVLSPWPLADPVVVPLPNVAKAYGRPRAAVGATITKTRPSGEMMAVSTWSIHAEIPSLALSGRVAQFTAVAAKAITPNPEHLLLAGDFNTTTLTSVVAIDELYAMFGLDRLTEPAGPSLRRAGRLFHLDHIFGRGVDVHGVGVERTVIASDHWPLWVDVVPAAVDQSD